MMNPLEYFEALAADQKRKEGEYRNRLFHLRELDAEYNKVKKLTRLLLDVTYYSPANQAVMVSETDLSLSAEGREFLERVKKKPHPV